MSILVFVRLNDHQISAVYEPSQQKIIPVVFHLSPPKVNLPSESMFKEDRESKIWRYQFLK